VSGYFNNADALIQAVTSLNGAGPGIYLTMNPVTPALLSRAANHITVHATNTTADRDVECRQWLLIDIDSTRPAGISATDSEHEAAIALAREIRGVLSEEGWPAPILADSGNGAHLLYHINLPNDDNITKLLKRVLEALARRFDNGQVKIDQSVFNPSRIVKLYGTPACKGDNVPERPHRLSRLLEVPNDIESVPAELLEEMAAQAKPEPQRDRRQSSGTFDVEGWIRRHQLDVREPVAWNGGKKWIFRRCPFDGSHTGSSAAIFESADGRFGFKCVHNACKDRTWRNLRELFEDPPPGAARGEAAGEWATPVPLQSELPPVEAFGEELLPESFRPLVLDVAERMQVPCDLPAIVAVLCLAGAVNRRARILPKVHDTSWLVVPNLWGGLIASPGFLKSPVIQTVISLLVRIQSEWRREYQRNFEYYTREKEAHEVQLAVWKSKLKSTKEDQPEPPRPTEPEKPVLRRLVVNDATFEALHQTMSENPAGILLIRDELTGWWSMLDRQGREGERAFCLQSWNGDTSHTVDRIGRGSVYVEACCMSMLGGIQPGRLRSYLVDALKDGPSNDGLIQRFQLLIWPDTAPAWEYVDRPPDVAAEDRVRRVFEVLAKLDPEPPQEYHFAPDAQELFIAWLSELEAKVRSGELHPALVSHLSKYRSLMPSLALLFELADAVARGEWSDTVSLDHTRQAAAWCKYLESHARRVYSCIVTPQIRAAIELADKIKHGKVGADGFFSCRDVYLKGWSSLDSAEAVIRAAEVLEDAGWIRTTGSQSTDPLGRGRPSSRYEINPAVRP
jgi:hypothetical protein